jgi:phage FluMu gp28-like protein
MTTAIAHEALWKAINVPGGTILIISPGLRQSRIPMQKIHSIIARHPILSSRIASENRDSLQFTNDSLIIALPNNPERIRGYDASDIYLDEAAHFLNDEPVMQVLKPMLISRKGTFTVVSTPFGKRGLFWEQYRDAIQRKDSDHDVKAYDFYPSTINPLVTQQDLARERENLTEMEFKQEYRGEFIEQVDVCFPLELIAGCVNSDLELFDEGDTSKSYFMGIDLAKQRDETVVIILEEISETGGLIVRHISAWSKMNYTEQIARIGQLSKSFSINNSAVDQTGVGEAVLENLKNVLPSVEGVTFTQQIKVKLIDSLRMLLEQKKLVLPNDSKLIMQMNGLRYTFSSVGNIIFHVPETNQPHDDYIWALALAVYAAQKPRPRFGIIRPVRVNW